LCDDIWIGIDGGATSVKARAVQVLEGRCLSPVGRGVEREFGTGTDFRPLPVEEQAKRLAAPGADLAPGEREAGAERIEVYANTVGAVIAELPPGFESARVRLALCAPGRSGGDRRGLLVVRSGPRQPGFLDELEAALEARALDIAVPPTWIESDGTAATWGEQYGAHGAFVSVGNAFAVGCGTGVAESLKLNGRLCEPGDFPEGWRAPWSHEPGQGCAEDRISMAALGRRWREAAGSADQAHPFPESAACAGDTAACDVLSDMAGALARFVADRIALLHRSDVVLQRVVLAQRAAALLSEPRITACFGEPLRTRLTECLARSSHAGAYLTGGRLEPDFIVPSGLRCAPILGAVARALGWPAEVD